MGKPELILDFIRSEKYATESLCKWEVNFFTTNIHKPSDLDTNRMVDRKRKTYLWQHHLLTTTGAQGRQGNPSCHYFQSPLRCPYCKQLRPSSPALQATSRLIFWGRWNQIRDDCPVWPWVSLPYSSYLLSWLKTLIQTLFVVSL